MSTSTKKESRSDCAISMALEAVGDKWSLLILRDLMFHGKRTYGELQSSKERIATNILASRLATLEEQDIIIKEHDPLDSRKSVYALTEKGIGLLPVIVELMHWMASVNPAASACGISKEAYEGNRVALYRNMMKGLRETHLPKKSLK